MATGGDLIEATCNHPTLGNSTFFFKAAEDGAFDLGGYFSADDANMVDGGGNMIDQINGTVWGGKGKPVGDYETNTNKATLAITIAGGGKLKKISG